MSTEHSIHLRRGHDNEKSLDSSENGRRATSFAVVGAESQRAYSRYTASDHEPSKNAAESSLAVLGKILSSEIKPKQSLIEPVLRFNNTDGTPASFQSKESLPRITVAGGEFRPSYDHRVTNESTTPTDLRADEIELQCFLGRSEEGFHFVGIDSGDSPANVVLDKNSVIELYLITQSTQIHSGLQDVATLPEDSPLARGATGKFMRSVTEGAMSYIGQHLKTPDSDLDVTKELAEENIAEVAKGSLITSENGVAFANSALSKIDTRISAITAESPDKATLIAQKNQIEAFATRWKAGEMPKPNELLEIFTTTNGNEINELIGELDSEIKNIDAKIQPGAAPLPESEVEHLKNIRMSLGLRRDELLKLRKGDERSVYHEFLSQAQNGELSEEHTREINLCLQNEPDPKEVLKLIEGIAGKHKIETIDPELKKTILEYLGEHKGEITIMIILTLLEIAKTGVTTVAQPH